MAEKPGEKLVWVVRVPADLNQSAEELLIQTGLSKQAFLMNALTQEVIRVKEDLRRARGSISRDPS